MTARQLAELMVGSELPSPETRESTVTDVEMLEVAGLDVLIVHVADRCSQDVSFAIHKGEVVGIAGVEGNGQAELVEAIMGMRPVEAGTITLGDQDISRWSTRARREAGIGYIPEDRHRHGAAARGAAVGEPHPRPPDPRAQRPRAADRPRRRATGHPAHRRRVRRAHARHRRARLGPLRRQPAEAHRRPRDERRPGAAHRRPPDPRRRRRRAGRDLGRTSGRPAATGWPCCWSRPTSTS